MKIENSNPDAYKFTVENNNSDPSSFCLEKENMNEHNKTGLKLMTKDMNQTICLFKKYLPTKTQHNMGKTNMAESEAIKSSPSRPLVPPKFFGFSQMTRPASFLERSLLPEIRCDAVETGSSDGKSSTAQLTIFYSGTVNVYDNVPLDKAQAIMLLANESSSPNLAAKKFSKTAVATPIHQSNLPSVCKLQAELPIARKYSIQRFLEKRRDRIINKSPYNAPSNTEKEDNDEQSPDGGSNRNHGFSPSPFPSRTSV